MKKEITIGLFGFGCVGQGLYDVLHASHGFRARIKKICVKDRNKPRSLAPDYFTFEPEEILRDEEINTVVELIDDADAAYQIVKTALIRGKNVVTANKKMLALHLEELVELQKQYGVSLLYEASACGSIPIIRNLEEYYDNDLLSSVSGIFNGSSNYLLTRLNQEGWSYERALKQAQDLGFAETDPTLDMEGIDAKFKLVILAYHSFGIYIRPEQVLNYGIQHIREIDHQLAREKGLKIKLVATVQKIHDKIALYVLPQFLSPDHYLYNVENEYNGVSVEAAFACTQTFIGKGAGGHPTGSAVLSDISALQYNYRYEYKKCHQGIAVSPDHNFSLEVYLRFNGPELPADVQFEALTEKYSSAAAGYVKGRVALAELGRKIKDLNDKGVFLAVTDPTLSPVVAVEINQPAIESEVFN